LNIMKTFIFHKKQTAKFCQPVIDNKSLPADHAPRSISNQQLQISDYSLPTAHCPLPTVSPRLPTDAGVVLIALLWILTALAVIALSFSRESRVEVAAARNAQDMERSYFIARSAIDATIYQIVQKRIRPNVPPAEAPTEPDPIDLGKVTGNFAGGVYQVDIQDESGKINVNLISEPQLKALVKAAGLEEPDAGIITDSILDWRDTDFLNHLNGAEDDYYQSLNPPYKAKNGRFDTVEELLLVRGMTRDYFYGKPERAEDGTITYRYGLSRLLTVYSSMMFATRIQVNVNYAPLPVLLSVPGMPEQAAKLIYEKRQVKPFKDVAEVSREIPIPLGAGTATFLTTMQTGILSLTAAAHMENSKARRIIRTVITISPRPRTLYQTLYWNENVSNYESMTP
jgi:general secretion pathway protein K